MPSVWIVTTFSRDPRRSGGVGVHMAALASGFGHLGYDVEVISRESLGSKLASLITALNGLDFLVHPLGSVIKALAGRRAIRRHLRKRLGQSAGGRPPDLVIFEDLYAVVPLGNQPVLGFVHALDSEEQARSPRIRSLLVRRSRPVLDWYRRLENEAALALPRWAAVSEEYRRHLAEIGLPLPPDRGGVIHPGIDVTDLEQRCQELRQEQRSEATEPGFTLVCTGVFTARKNQAFLLDVLRLLPPWVRLLLIGDGVEKARLQAKAVQLGIADRVDFKGFLTGHPKIAALAQGDLFVFPSLKESFGIALLEAKVCGLPTLAAPIEVPPVLVDFVLPLDPEQWAAEILRLAEHTGTRPLEGEAEAGEFDARPFSDVRMAEEVLSQTGV